VDRGLEISFLQQKEGDAEREKRRENGERLADPAKWPIRFKE